MRGTCDVGATPGAERGTANELTSEHIWDTQHGT